MAGISKIIAIMKLRRRNIFSNVYKMMYVLDYCVTFIISHITNYKYLCRKTISTQKSKKKMSRVSRKLFYNPEWKQVGFLLPRPCFDLLFGSWLFHIRTSYSKYIYVRFLTIIHLSCLKSLLTSYTRSDYKRYIV